MIIPLKEWAERHGVAPVSARQKAARGNLPTAIKMGRDWFIEEDVPNTDNRIKTGKYIKKENKNDH